MVKSCGVVVVVVVGGGGPRDFTVCSGTGGSFYSLSYSIPKSQSQLLDNLS